MTRTIRRSARHAAPLLALSALLLVLAAPAGAETPASADCGPSLASLLLENPQALLFPPAPTEARQGGEIGGPSALSTCTADCGSGNYVSCTGDTCSKVDRNCSVGQRGYCEADGQYKYCAPCDNCVADCWDGSTVICEGSSCSATDSDCDSGIRGHCTGDSGTTYCPALPVCNDSTSCTAKNGSYCSGTQGSSDCSFSDACGCGSCFCDTFAKQWVCTL